MPSFKTLAEAVQALADALEMDDSVALAALCREELPAEWVLKRLRKIHAATPLPESYRNREFPADQNSFKLGGHESELGHIHINLYGQRQGGR